MTKIEKVLFTGKTHTTGSKGGPRHHGNLDLHLTTPGNDTAPTYAYEAVQSHPTAEQLFAGAWSACYIAALGLAAKELKVAVPAETSRSIRCGNRRTSPLAAASMVSSSVSAETSPTMARTSSSVTDEVPSA